MDYNIEENIEAGQRYDNIYIEKKIKKNRLTWPPMRSNKIKISNRNTNGSWLLRLHTILYLILIFSFLFGILFMTLYQCYLRLVKPNIVSIMVSQLGFLTLPPILSISLIFIFCFVFLLVWENK